nr:hypothetical protein [Candidatus Sigynarchaeota archaeon]
MRTRTIAISITILAAIMMTEAFCMQVRAGLTPDPYEPNGSRAEARALTNGTYELNFDHLGDIDYFNISVEAGDTLTVQVSTVGNLTLDLMNETSTITTLNIVNGAGTNNIVHVATYTGNHTIDVVSNSGGEYTLTISTSDPTGNQIPGYETIIMLLGVSAGVTFLSILLKRKIG